MAENGEQAVEYTLAVHPDLVLLDVMMPGMGGIKALQEIMAHPPTPIIIMLTGLPDLQVATVAKELGAMCVALGGVDQIVFTGGIGEHDVRVRAEVCARLSSLGVELDAARNHRPETST